MKLPKTINVPLDELERAKSLDEVKRIVKRFMLDWRQSYERIYAALQTKADSDQSHPAAVTGIPIVQFPLHHQETPYNGGKKE